MIFWSAILIYILTLLCISGVLFARNYEELIPVLWTLGISLPIIIGLIWFLVISFIASYEWAVNGIKPSRFEYFGMFILVSSMIGSGSATIKNVKK